MDSFKLDLRYAFNSLIRAPLVTVASVLSIATGIGAGTAVYSWMDSLVLNPFPVIVNPDALVGLNVAGPNGARWPLSYPAFRDWRRESRSFSGVAAWTVARLASRTGGEIGAVPATVMLTSGNYFDVLGVRPSMGRMLGPRDEADAVPVAVIGEAYWRSRLGARSEIIGTPIVLNGEPLTIIGVAPKDFSGTSTRR